MEKLPVIDISAFRSGDTAESDLIVREVAQACMKTGFFYLAGHGVSVKLIEKVHLLALAFFRSSEDRKLTVAATRERYRGYIPAEGFAPRSGGQADLYQQFKFQCDFVDNCDLVAGSPLQGPNRWPDWIPEFNSTMMAYHVALSRLASDLLRLFALALGFDELVFHDHFKKPLSPVSLLYYPARSRALENRWGVHPHRDDDAFTILFQDEVGGLEVQHRDGSWIEAPPIPNTFVINIGNMMECWSGGRFISTPHRVVNRSQDERVSMPYFAIPDFDSIISPLPGIEVADHLEDHVIHVGQHMIMAYNGNWSEMT